VLLVGRKLHRISHKFRSLLAIFAHNLIDIADFQTNLTQERQDFYRNHITPLVPPKKIWENGLTHEQIRITTLIPYLEVNAFLNLDLYLFCNLIDVLIVYAIWSTIF
jgi:hypothetical protein